MKKIFITLAVLLLATSFLLTGCQAGASQESPGAQSGLKVMAVESFLADIAQNVAGERIKVETLMPAGLDPHAFEPTPRDVVRIAESDLLILNGAGFEAWAEETLANAGGERLVIEASAGLESRADRAGETALETNKKHAEDATAEPAEDHDNEDGDPHFWLNPLNVIQYVENIRDGLIEIDPAGRETYTANATAYIEQLKALDAWIEQQVSTIPVERRLMVTNHESFGYFADRYGFTIIGTLIPSVSTSAAPSAQQLARLADTIRATGASAIFLETGANPQLAEQISQETRIKVVTDLYSHSLTTPGGPAPSYLEMMKHNLSVVVGALK